MLTFMRLKVVVLSCRQTLLFYEWISTTDFFVVLPFGRADKTDFPLQHRTQRLRDTARELNKFSPASSSYCVLCEGAPSLPLGMQQGLCYEIASSCNKGKELKFQQDISGNWEKWFLWESYCLLHVLWTCFGMLRTPGLATSSQRKSRGFKFPKPVPKLNVRDSLQTDTH